ncbi:MAG: hypothetical protein JNK85_27305 [Verrucomicrobiales bacterium]|nr:hypothetical protein [Verrucomicrobiales bacterium]
MDNRRILRGAVAVAAIGAAVYFVAKAVVGKSPPGEKAFFYDLSAGKIFVASRTAVAPIPGLDGPEEDGYRALVISATGRPEDRSSWQVAYLEKYSPELKRAMEAAQKSGEPLAMGRLAAQAQRFVRRLTDTDWVPSNAPEADAVLSGWARPGPDGVTPVVCSP